MPAARLVPVLFRRPAAGGRTLPVWIAVACIAGLGASRPGRAAADPSVTLGNRLETRWDEPTNETQVDDWFDGRVFDDHWRTHLRLRVRQFTADNADSTGVEQRSLTLDMDRIEVTGGTFYETIGRGLVLRAYENRFVSLAGSDRSFSLDRDVDGARVRSEGDFWEFLAVSGKPRLTVANGGTATPQTGLRLDLVQTVSGDLHFFDGLLSAGATILQADRESLRRPEDDANGAPEQTLRSVRGETRAGPGTLYLEWADLRWAKGQTGVKNGRALYVEATGAAGDWGGSLEYKNYDRYSFPYAEPPTLIRTHSSVLLNTSTHVLKPTEEGVQLEVLRSADPEITTTVNLTGAWSEFFGRSFRYREAFLEHRVDEDPVSWIAFADWAEDTFTGDDNRWTGGLSAEAHVTPEHSVFVDGETQRVDPDGQDGFSNGFVQAGYSRAGLVSAALRFQWTTREKVFDDDRTTWLGGTLNVEIGEQHTLFIFGGRRPPGLVCSGGFCFFAPEFDGIEARLLSAF